MSQETEHDSRRYSQDKPESCEFCYFWAGKKYGCELPQCYYLLPEEPKAQTAGVHKEEGCRWLSIWPTFSLHWILPCQNHAGAEGGEICRVKGTALFPFHYGDEAESYTFYRVPKILFTEKVFDQLSTDAKLLYGLLLDRMQLP